MSRTNKPTPKVEGSPRDNDDMPIYKTIYGLARMDFDMTTRQLMSLLNNLTTGFSSSCLWLSANWQNVLLRLSEQPPGLSGTNVLDTCLQGTEKAFGLLRLMCVNVDAHMTRLYTFSWMSKGSLSCFMYILSVVVELMIIYSLFCRDSLWHFFVYILHKTFRLSLHILIKTNISDFRFSLSS